MAELQPVAAISNPLSALQLLNTVVAMATLLYFEKTLACPTILTEAKLLFGFGFGEAWQGAEEGCSWGSGSAEVPGTSGLALVLWLLPAVLWDKPGALGSVPALVA